MTVISTILTKEKIAVASDGYITNTETGKILKNDIEKFVPFPSLKCVASFWGTAEYGDWTLKGWLEDLRLSVEKHPEYYLSVEKFGEILTARLNAVLESGALKMSKSRGIGIHLAAFEEVDDQFIPELFLISNYSLKDGRYFVPEREKLGFSRRTFRDFGTDNLFKAKRQRHFINQIISKGSKLIFFNGDPILFNNFSSAVRTSLVSSRNAGLLKTMSSDEELENLASYPIELVKEFQNKFFKDDKIIVGGKISYGILDSSGKWISR